MKLLAIGDLHGRNVWKEADITGADRVIFLGDYTDSFHFTDEIIYQNLLDIIALKRRYPDKVKLLFGNHDAPYIFFPQFSCSGFRPRAQPALSNLFAKHYDYFQVAYQEGPYLFSHAGVTNRWYQHRKNSFPPDSTQNLAEQLIGIQQNRKLRHFLLESGPARGGIDICSGPVWADRSETKIDYLKDYHQVVGHTPTPEIITFGDATSSITYCDVTQTGAAFYEINDQLV